MVTVVAAAAAVGGVSRTGGLEAMSRDQNVPGIERLPHT